MTNAVPAPPPPGIYTAASTGRTIKAILFDTFGTVVDWRSGVAARVAAHFATSTTAVDPYAFADHWRSLYEPSMDAVRSGERPFTPLDVLHRENLERTITDLGLGDQAERIGDLDQLNTAWEDLRGWPDSIAGLHALKASATIGPLSNGTTAMLTRMAKRAALPWDVIIGSDLTRAYKPQPQAYQRTAELLDIEPGELMLAAAHNRDLAGAAAAGLATAFIARPHELGPDQSIDLGPEGPWDLAVTSIPELAAAIAADAAQEDS